jgi:hypothetical protein
MTKPIRCIVNVQENGDMSSKLYNTSRSTGTIVLTILINQNEQSLSLRVSGDGLEPEDSEQF